MTHSRIIVLLAIASDQDHPTPRRNIHNRYAVPRRSLAGKADRDDGATSGFRHMTLHHRNGAKADRCDCVRRQEVFAAVSTPIWTDQQGVDRCDCEIADGSFQSRRRGLNVLARPSLIRPIAFEPDTEDKVASAVVGFPLERRISAGTSA